MILTQGPLESTAPHFWQMTFEYRSPVIVMLTAEIEQARVKCHGYWPPLKKKKYQFGAYVVENLNTKRNAHFVTSSLRITKLNSGEVLQKMTVLLSLIFS